MISRIQALSFRSLQWTDQRLRRFQALVGPNASGKTTFMDVIGLLSELMRNRGNVFEAVQSRSSTFENLLWLGKGNNFELAIEAEIPETIRLKLPVHKQSFSHVRYEIRISLNEEINEVGLDHEVLWMINPDTISEHQPTFLSSIESPPKTILKALLGGNNGASLVWKVKDISDIYARETTEFYSMWKIGRQLSTLASVPRDYKEFPVSLWFRDLLEQGVQNILLNSEEMRNPSPPGQGWAFRPDGSNLPWVIDDLRKQPDRFKGWLRHVQTALEDIRDITTVVRPEDRHRYLVVEYQNGAQVPSWLVSDGTLRLLALTILAWLPDMKGTFLIEEPENGIHPSAIETVMQALSSMYNSQVLVATHSPVALNMLQPEDILCFAKNAEGATDIVAGNLHPVLQAWKQGQPELGILFASGILS